MTSKSVDLSNKIEMPKALLRGFYGFCALLLVIDLSSHRHIVHDLEHTPLFYALFGLAVCLVFLLIARIIGIAIKRNPGFYDAD